MQAPPNKTVWSPTFSREELNEIITNMLTLPRYGHEEWMGKAMNQESMAQTNQRREDVTSIHIERDPRTDFYRFRIQGSAFICEGGPYQSRAQALIMAGAELQKESRWH